MTKQENEERLARLKNIVLSMPEKPGSYQYYDENHTIIYVGKAKNLKRRVSSYFHKEVDRYKTKVLVSKIHDISYTVVNTEEDALLLENSLIKKYNPRYNVLLKDGKTYPSICVTNEYFPRIFKTRHINKKVGAFFGPYPHIGSMYAVLEVIKKLYKPRTCRMPITREGVAEGRYKPCLEYHIHNCGAPCINKQSYEEYQENMRQAREILKGNTREVSKYLYDLMSLENAWKILVCYAYRRVCLAVFQQDIVSWIILFDQAVFEQKCVFFCVYDRIRYVVNLRNKHLCLISVYFFMEVGRYSSLQIFRLSHIYNRMIFVVILVASWLFRHT
jgi:hypothetical protein